MISIHALRGEGDADRPILSMLSRGFQSTPSVGRATETKKVGLLKRLFQSTPSVGRATAINWGNASMSPYFNPRPPWGGRRSEVAAQHLSLVFQSTPSVGRATRRMHYGRIVLLFQSTPSVGRATAKTYKYTTLCLYIVHIKLYIFATAVLFT